MKQVTRRNVIILLVVTCLYCLNRFWLKKVILLPTIGYILRCHFNDFLAGTAIIAYINLMLSLSKYRGKELNTLPMGIVVSFACGMLWEYLLPVIVPHGVSDFLDVVAYMLGGTVYILLSRYCVLSKKIGGNTKS